MRFHAFLKLAGGTLAAGIGLFLLLTLVSHLSAPKGEQLPPQVTAEQVREVEAQRKMDIDPAAPLRLQVEVDYSEGEKAAWYPKGEAPILAGLVAKGEIPPVADRVGPEPCVARGVDGIGTYGGTWIRIANSENDVNVINNRLSYSYLLRWSPQGHPIVPHVAKSFEVSPDGREFTIRLRRGLMWSDGKAPYTADDIMYWWNEEVANPKIYGSIPEIMLSKGKPGTIEKIDDYTVVFRFPEPNGLFPERLATAASAPLTNTPAHYLRQYHPELGDKDLINDYMQRRKLPNALAVYRDVKNIFNPLCPRLWPWLYRTFRSKAPQSFVRNPYYFMVDTEGNQLPYIDRVLFEVKTPDMLGISVSNGEVSMQARHVRYDMYTLLMDQRDRSERNGYEVYHWYPGDRSQYAISPNLNRRVEPDKPDTKWKAELLSDKRFRQALSMAIDRDTIIDAEFDGMADAAQVAPGPISPFYDEGLYKSFVQYDPDRANQLLDDLGLVQRDGEGYRMFPDGTRMTFYFHYCGFTGDGPGQFVVDDWGKVGVRTIMRERSRALFYTEKAALTHDFSVWIGNGEYFPLIAPRYFIPFNTESNYAIGYARWYMRGGLQGNPRADRAHGCIEPPADHPLREAMVLYEQAISQTDPEEQKRIFQKVLDIAAENVWTINVCTPPPVLAVVKDGFRNVPRNVVASWDFQTPGNAGLETYYFDEPSDSEGAIADMTDSILNPTLADDAPDTENTGGTDSGMRLGRIVRWAILGIIVCLLLMTAVRHPYIGRRLLIMVPTLLIMSVVTFVVIQLPPGDYVSTRIMQLQESGDEADLQQIEDLKDMFYLEESVAFRYFRWLGLHWFRTFDSKDRGLLQGNMGRSMESGKMVNQIVGDRIVLTILISLGTILFTWVFAIPIGIYSAVKQYSIGDYILTFLGFIGMCVPGFLLALLLMYVSTEWFDIPVSGLFSSEYGAQPEWTMGKVIDLLKHIWVPVAVLGVGGTAGMIRVMRANLLDELKKPYVVTARAKGVRPLKLLFKYPVRMALNPFISGVGGLFPQLVSGGAIVAMVLSLPTVGPLMLSALMSEDMYLAGSMLMVLSLLGVLGTLVSDLLLLWLDPRIRMGNPSK
jgi:ABC-type dipeptide/oligopeptide/nickel transport system permease component/ABC-type transport system substrate-binding protein